MKIANAASVGFMVGRTIVPKILISPAPSMRAASTIDVGKVDMACLMRNTPNGNARSGKISAW